MFRLAGARKQLEEAACRDPNRGRSDLQSDALPTELSRLMEAGRKALGQPSMPRLIRPTLAAGRKSVNEAPSTKTYTRPEANTCNSLGGRVSKKMSKSRCRPATREGGVTTTNCRQLKKGEVTKNFRNRVSTSDSRWYQRKIVEIKFSTSNSRGRGWV